MLKKLRRGPYFAHPCVTELPKVKVVGVTFKRIRYKDKYYHSTILLSIYFTEKIADLSDKNANIKFHNTLI